MSGRGDNMSFIRANDRGYNQMSAVVASVKLYTDGACRPNPGSGSIGVLLLDQDDQELESHCDNIGYSTNNRAEYHALIKGLDLAARHCRKTIYCFLDSDIVIKQLNGVWRLKDDELRKLSHAVKDKERPFERVVYTHAERSSQYMKRADALSKQALR